MNSEDPDKCIVDRAVDTLAEHFDAVTIFVSKYDPTTGYTNSRVAGCGNFFTRLGHVKDWVLNKDEESNIAVRKREEED